MTYSLIPETAPFTPEQRAWLNGFLAGWMGLDATNRMNGAIPAAVLETLPPPTAAPKEPEETFPWHDPNLTIVERLELAEGKPLERRLMAAMAQLDCGACGYVCKTYSEAIVGGTEKNLTLCSPGGKNTAKAIKQLLKNGGGANGNDAAKAQSNGHASNGQASNGDTNHGHASNGASAGGSIYHRNNPFLARLKSTRNLNKPGSAKHTAHVVLDLAGSGLTYRVGDALGVYPTNPPELVDTILAVTRLDSEKSIAAPNGQDMSLRDALRRQYCLRTAPEELLILLAKKAVIDAERHAIEAALADESYENFDVLDALQLAPSAELSESELLDVLPPLAPRLYSIASSLKAHPEEVHLTVGRVAYELNGRQRLGVASTMFADRVQTGDPVGVFIHSASDFTVPADTDAPMIMVGPGTGIAPFRAFLEERVASAAPGKNWLFFGDQCAATDYLYQEELVAMQGSGFLTRLDVAFSRDQAHKIYVQDRMREHGAELFRWLEAGGYFFVCGDAKRMAADVDRALHDVIATHGSVSADKAKEYVNRLKLQKRYVRDVY
jgi:sulfite reductase (NADPH) flavoprotein alpha-component